MHFVHLLTRQHTPNISLDPDAVIAESRREMQRQGSDSLKLRAEAVVRDKWVLAFAPHAQG